MRSTGTGASAFHPASVPLAIDAEVDAWPSLASMLIGSARAHADDVAFRLFGATLRYREVLAHADALAASFAAARIGRGDRVALMLPNLFQHPVTVLAILRIGAVGGQREPAVDAARARPSAPRQRRGWGSCCSTSARAPSPPRGEGHRDPPRG